MREKIRTIEQEMESGITYSGKFFRRRHLHQTVELIRSKDIIKNKEMNSEKTMIPIWAKRNFGSGSLSQEEGKGDSRKKNMNPDPWGQKNLDPQNCCMG